MRLSTPTFFTATLGVVEVMEKRRYGGNEGRSITGHVQRLGDRGSPKSVSVAMFMKDGRKDGRTENIPHGEAVGGVLARFHFHAAYLSLVHIPSRPLPVPFVLTTSLASADFARNFSGVTFGTEVIHGVGELGNLGIAGDCIAKGRVGCFCLCGSAFFSSRCPVVLPRYDPGDRAKTGETSIVKGAIVCFFAVSLVGGGWLAGTRSMLYQICMGRLGNGCSVSSV